MRPRFSRFLAAAVAIVLLLPGLSSAQRGRGRGEGRITVPARATAEDRAALAQRHGAPPGWTVPRTSDGHPDLRGVWVEPGGPRGGRKLSELLTDPPEGGIPALTAQAQEDWDALQAYLEEHPADTWADRSLGERCVTLGAPVRANFNQYYKLVQNKDHVVIVMEWIHEARVILLDGSPHPDPDIQLWLGDSRGRWEGESLVVETTNYLPKGYAGTHQRGTPQGWFHSLNSKELVVTERFTLIAPDLIFYDVTIDDPLIWARPWTVMIPLKKQNEPLFEFACHEGNYNLANILSGARVSEQEAAAAEADSK